MIMGSSLNKNNNWLHVADVGGQRHVMCFRQKDCGPSVPVVQPHARKKKGFCDLMERKTEKNRKMLLLPCRLDELLNTNVFLHSDKEGKLGLHLVSY